MVYLEKYKVDDDIYDSYNELDVVNRDLVFTGNIEYDYEALVSYLIYAHSKDGEENETT